ncbi:hypothetical protein [Pseudodesulfovibrio sediminis]|uniref:Uncharacterized protein n=1 Tax=Pseudodesulfovibrio sediminis TaxID=2810563 RepID=A0ABM7P405_9BACT|nr:hypothetical protein [Pseudodesulfovibrio sediminis]BCS87494.1 hypothetical protein PSDVSF_07360 [Pseudodesulfovibrio sediminis]
MHVSFRIFVIAALLLCLGASVVYAEEQPPNPVEVKGLIVTTREGLTINDGTRDYLLLGVDDIGIEGRICIIFGNLMETDKPTIDVYEVHLVSDDFPKEDDIGLRKEWHTLTRTTQFHPEHARLASPCDQASWNYVFLTSEKGRNDVMPLSR